MKTSILSLIALSSFFSWADAEFVSGVTAKQRWPWNGIVDIDFTLTGKAGEQYRIGIEASSANSGTFYAKTYLTEPIVVSGKNRISWDFGRDYPGVKDDSVMFSVSAFPLSADEVPTYMVIDISAGTNAEKWPVRYTSVAPTHTPGCLTDKCKLSELWLRRVHVKDVQFCYRRYESVMGDEHFFAKLTKDFYIAIFPTTQQQWYLMSGAYSSVFETDRETRPVDSFVANTLYKNYKTYIDGGGTGIGGTVTGSKLESIRTRTGLRTIDLPTDAQWVYALHNGPCKAGVYRYCDATGKQYAYSECSRYKDNSGTVEDMATADLDNGTASVGCYAPNAIGLYDMIGNVGEVIKNIHRNDTSLKAYYDGLGTSYPVLDPIEKTNPSATTQFSSICFPTGWKGVGDSVTCWWDRYSVRCDYSPAANKGVTGFRFCVTVE